MGRIPIPERLACLFQYSRKGRKETGQVFFFEGSNFFAEGFLAEAAAAAGTDDVSRVGMLIDNL